MIASTLHASSVSAIAIYLLLFDASAEYRLWQTLALPLSLSYFVADACW